MTCHHGDDVMVTIAQMLYNRLDVKMEIHIAVKNIPIKNVQRSVSITEGLILINLKIQSYTCLILLQVRKILYLQIFFVTELSNIQGKLNGFCTQSSIIASAHSKTRFTGDTGNAPPPFFSHFHVVCFHQY